MRSQLRTYLAMNRAFGAAFRTHRARVRKATSRLRAVISDGCDFRAILDRNQRLIVDQRSPQTNNLIRRFIQ
jgi:hypothetical protein